MQSIKKTYHDNQVPTDIKETTSEDNYKSFHYIQKKKKTLILTSAQFRLLLP